MKEIEDIVQIEYNDSDFWKEDMIEEINKYIRNGYEFINIAYSYKRGQLAVLVKYK